jgi:hypothetical protein
MRIEVFRSPGDRTGPEINDSLISTDEAARERGRIEIDRNSTPRELVTLNLPLTAWVQPGLLAEIQDADGGSWRGLVTGCSLVIGRDGDNMTAEQVVTLEREVLG